MSPEQKKGPPPPVGVRGGLAEAPATALARGSQFTEVDGLRGVAILAVLLHHFWPDGVSSELTQRFINAGWAGVDLFFVVSGFLITGNLFDTRGRPGYYRSFYVRRALRIFPLYYLSLFALFTLVPLLHNSTALEGSFDRTAGSPAWYALYLATARVILCGWINQMLGLIWYLTID